MRSKKSTQREYRKKLRKMSSKQLANEWAAAAERYYNCDDENTPDDTDMIRNIIYGRRYFDDYIEAVDSLGMRKILRPWYVLREHLFYSINGLGQHDEDIKRRIKQGNLKPYLKLIVIPHLTETTKIVFSEDDITEAIDSIKEIVWYC